MRRELHQEESLFPNFAGFADLMSALCLLFVIVAGILLFQYKLKVTQINSIQLQIGKLKLENKNLLAEKQKLEADTASMPKIFIIPNELNGKVFFKTGEATIQNEFYNTLDLLASQIQAELLQGKYNFVEIQGHTDRQRISTWKFQDNWDLGSARAIAVVRYFILKGIQPEQLSAVSHGEFKPADVEESDEAFSKNRRIEITLLKK